jgi:heat-inducible transcriptional repressor
MEVTHMMTERQMLILRMVVDDYVRSAEPVGSRTISKHSDLSLSAATIRNEMADLEELGYLEQPHTSAGRIPSQIGYRYYVDNLLSADERLNTQDVGVIRSLFAERIGEIERIGQQTAQVLSSLTHYTSVVMGPQIYDATLRSLQVVGLTERSAVLLVVTSTGQVQNKTVTFPEGISIHEVSHLVEILNRNLQGTPMYRIRSRVMEEIMREVAREVEDYEEALRLLDQIVSLVDEDAEDRLYLGGATNMLLQPEFRDVQKVKSVLSWLEHPDFVLEALRQVGNDDELIRWKGLRGIDLGKAKAKVRIGVENDVLTLQDCSLITATYNIGSGPPGVIGVIGPTRMDYGRVIHLLEHLSGQLTNLYSQWYKE